MGGTFSLIVGISLVGISLNLGSDKPYDWLTTPAQKYMEKNPGHKDMAINYAPSIAMIGDATEDYKRHAGSHTFRNRALMLQGVNSNDPSVRKLAVQDVMVNNRRWGSHNLGDSVRYAQM